MSNKMKPNKGLLKRIRITKSGKVKFHRAFGRHLRSGKSGQLLRSYRKPAFAKDCDTGRIQAMLPGVRIRGNKPKSAAPAAAATTSAE